MIRVVESRKNKKKWDKVRWMLIAEWTYRGTFMSSRIAQSKHHPTIRLTNRYISWVKIDTSVGSRSGSQSLAERCGWASWEEMNRIKFKDWEIEEERWREKEREREGGRERNRESVRWREREKERDGEIEKNSAYLSINISNSHIISSNWKYYLSLQFSEG